MARMSIKQELETAIAPKTNKQRVMDTFAQVVFTLLNSLEPKHKLYNPSNTWIGTK